MGVSTEKERLRQKEFNASKVLKREEGGKGKEI